jgi:hypothetical protein
MADSAQWYAIVDTTGTLISTGTTIADTASLAAAGYSAIELADDPGGKIWDPATQAFKPAPPLPVVLVPWQFIRLFTVAEFTAISASQDPQIRLFLLMVQTTPTINLSDAIVTNGIAYLVAQNLINSDRATQILSNTPAPSGV